MRPGHTEQIEFALLAGMLHTARNSNLAALSVKIERPAAIEHNELHVGVIEVDRNLSEFGLILEWKADGRFHHTHVIILKVSIHVYPFVAQLIAAYPLSLDIRGFDLSSRTESSKEKHGG